MSTYCILKHDSNEVNVAASTQIWENQQPDAITKVLLPIRDNKTPHAMFSNRLRGAFCQSNVTVCKYLHCSLLKSEIDVYLDKKEPGHRIYESTLPQEKINRPSTGC